MARHRQEQVQHPLRWSENRADYPVRRKQAPVVERYAQGSLDGAQQLAGSSCHHHHVRGGQDDRREQGLVLPAALPERLRLYGGLVIRG